MSGRVHTTHPRKPSLTLCENREARPDVFQSFYGNTRCVNSKASQLAISSRSGLRRIGVTPVKAGVHFGHFLRWFVISRLMRDTSASARRSSASGALRAIIAKYRSYFSRSSLAIALNFGQVARSIVDLRGWVGIEVSPPPSFLPREVPRCLQPVRVGCVEFDGRGQV